MSTLAERIHHRHGFGDTQPAAAPRYEPGRTAVHDEADIRNQMLDLLEAQVRTLLAAGLEVQVAARLARLVPALAAAPQPSAPAIDAVTWSQILAALRLGALARLDEAGHRSIAKARSIVVEQMQASRAADDGRTA